MADLKKVSAAGLGLSLLSRDALACSACTAGQMWELYPPLLQWSLSIVAWFVGWMLVALIAGRTLWPFPRVWVTGLLLLLLLLPPAWVLWPLVALPVGILLVAGWIRLITRRNLNERNRSDFWLHSITVTALAMMLISSIVEAVSPTPRGTIDIIKKWPGTQSERQAFEELREEEPRSRQAYQEIVRGGGVDFGELPVWRAAEGLRRIGPVDADFVLLLDAYERLYDPDFPWMTGSLRFEIGKMLRRELPDDTSPLVLRRIWEERKSATEPSSKANPEAASADIP